MSYIPQRTFNGMPGEPSTDTMGPEQISHDLDELCKMFNRNSVHSDGSPGGIGAENINPTGFDIHLIGGVGSADILDIKQGDDGELQFTTDGETFISVKGIAAFDVDEDGYPDYEDLEAIIEAGRMPCLLVQGLIYWPLAYDFGQDKFVEFGWFAIHHSSGKTTGFIALEICDEDSNWTQDYVSLSPSASPEFTGTPTAPTPSAGDESTKIATTKFVADALAGLFNSPTFTGSPKAPTQASGTSDTTIATTEFVQLAVQIAGGVTPASETPLMDDVGAVGSSIKYARADHVHPSDTSRAPIASPDFTGEPTAPTAESGTDTTQIATTAFVQAALSAYKKLYTTTVTLAANGWNASSLTQGVALAGASPTMNVIVSPAPNSWEEASACGVYCNLVGVPSGTIGFKCAKIPSTNLTINVIYF